MQALPSPIDFAAVGELAQHAVERGAVGVLGAERAGNLAGTNGAPSFADEG